MGRKIKQRTIIAGLLVVLSGISASALAAFDSGSTGADGVLTPSNFSTTVCKDYQQESNSCQVRAKSGGFYNYSSINITSGSTVTFEKNANNDPITLRVKGDVTISGTVSVDGTDANVSNGKGGPGGYDGGYGGAPNSNGYRGQGPGGGLGATIGCGGSGSFGTAGVQGVGATGLAGTTYGNSSLIPLQGGSGGGGGYGAFEYGGGGGGGAIVIGSNGDIRIDASGRLTAKGGGGRVVEFNSGGGGSGGAIRLVANTITVNGTISAAGAPAVSGGCRSGGSSTDGSIGGNGRIRLEANVVTVTGSITPAPSRPNFLPEVLTPILMPKLKITKITLPNQQVINVNPPVAIGNFRSPDVMLPYNSTGSVTVTVTAENIPLTSPKTVTVNALPESGITPVTGYGTLDGTDSASSVDISLNLSSSVPYVLSASVQ